MCALLPSAGAVANIKPNIDLRHQSVREHAPLYFEPNAGQFPGGVQFIARSGAWMLVLAENEIVLAGSQAPLRIPILGADPASRWRGEAEFPAKVNYLIGRDKSKWATNLPTYASIRRAQVYPGIDMQFNADGRKLEYRFHVGAGADASQIRLSAAGLTATALPNGDLQLSGSNGSVHHRNLRAFQQVNGKRVPVAASFDIATAGEVRFSLGSYDHTRPLVIDPVVSYYFYLGGRANDNLNALVADAAHIYAAGSTNSIDFFLAGTPWSASNSGRNDAFISKFLPNGNPIFSTYFGGQDEDEATAIALDEVGFPYLTGTTTSTNWPLSESAIQATYGGNTDAFLLKFNLEGSGYIYSSYLGGSAYDYGSAVASDAFGNAVFGGGTSSSDFPTRNARQAVFGGLEDIWIYRLNPNGGTTEYSTYFGGTEADQAQAMTMDKQGNVYIAGRTTCTGLPAGTLGPGGGTDILVIKWRADGNGATYVTCIGGNGIDSAYGIAIDSANNVYVVGATSSTNFPVVFPVQSNYGGAVSGSIGDAFVLKVNATGNALLYSTYLGGSRDDIAYNVMLDATGGAYVAGTSLSLDFPAAGSTAPSVGRFGFIARVSPQGNSLLQTLFLEGIADNGKFLGLLDAAGGLYMGGSALASTPISSTGTSPLVAFRGPVQDCFIAKFAQARLELYNDTFTSTVQPGSTFTLVQRLVNRGPEDALGASIRGQIPPGLSVISCTVPGGFCSLAASPSGTSYRVDSAALIVGRGIQITLQLAVPANANPGSVLTLSTFAVSDSYDSVVFDNSLTTYVFVVGAGTVCNYSVAAPALVFPNTSSNATFNVQAPVSCSWAAQSANFWITASTSNIATGPANVTFTLALNPSSLPRIGSVTVAGQRFTILQRGGTNVPFFNDVPVSNAFFDYIQLLRSNGVTTGCGSGVYCPNDTTSRGQMAVFIIRSMFGGDNFPFPTAPYFTDVPNTNSFFKYIQKMRELGITSGCGATTYCPDAVVTRAQMAVFLVRGRLAVSSGQSFGFPDTFTFADVPSTNPAYSAIQKMKELGITTGCGANTYCPEESTTRGQMAVFLTRTFFTP